ncbi:hypothetical protein LOD44_11650, partial [Xylella fastidiosa subsp. multiplex]|uniref:hypothetical protein n=1 Tax=Xylella fastidiosa TaxID=2371 RepID=UPI001C4AF841
RTGGHHHHGHHAASKQRRATPARQSCILILPIRGDGRVTNVYSGDAYLSAIKRLVTASGHRF